MSNNKVRQVQPNFLTMKKEQKTNTKYKFFKRFVPAFKLTLIIYACILLIIAWPFLALACPIWTNQIREAILSEIEKIEKEFDRFS